MAYLMKGKNWKDRESFRKKLEYPVYVEPKVDDIRVRVTVFPEGSVRFLSFAEKPLHNLGFAADAFRRLAQQFDIFEFDCGFRCNGNFNDSYRWVRSSKTPPPELENSYKVFYIFDLPDMAGRVYPERRFWVETMLQWLDSRLPGHCLRQLSGYTADCEKEVERLYLRFRREGREGAMVKSTKHLYQQGARSQDWLKMKPEDTADGKITEVNQAISIDGDPLPRAGSVTLQLEDGSTATPHGIPHALGAQMWAHKDSYINEWVEFKYMERDRQGGYRHPTFVRLREAKA